MRTMLMAFVSIAVIAVAADRVLQDAGFSAAERNTSSSVRLD